MGEQEGGEGMSELEERAEELAEEIMQPQSHMEVSLDPPTREKRRVVTLLADALRQVYREGAAANPMCADHNEILTEAYLKGKREGVMSELQNRNAELSKAERRGVEKGKIIAESLKHKPKFYHYLCYCGSTVLVYEAWGEQCETVCPYCRKTIRGYFELKPYQIEQNRAYSDVIRDLKRLLSEKEEA